MIGAWTNHLWQSTLFAVMPPWGNGLNGKSYRAALGRKPVGGTFSVELEEPYRWKDSVQNGDEIRMWAVDGIAQGLRPWFAKFNAKPFDRRWMKPVEDLYRWHHKNERYLRNEENLARIGLVYSQQTAKFHARTRSEDHVYGFYQALVESRLPFEMVHDRKLEASAISRFKTLVLPNIACLSDSQCDQLREYVKRGGSIVATYETSLYDEYGRVRRDFGLADLFGARWTRNMDVRMQNSYVSLHHPDPLHAGLEDTPRIINGVSRVHTELVKGRAPMTVIPTYPDLPMEDVYPRTASTNVPAVHVQEIGAGRVVYFPWDIDRTFWEVLAVDHLKLLRNAVQWAANEDQPVSITSPGIIDIAVWRQKESMTVHLVNLTNPMTMKGPVRELLPVGPEKVRVQLPQSAKARALRLLVAEREPSVKRIGQVLEVEVPAIGLHEVIAIDLV